jgi:uncharacterized membrane protein
MFTLLAFGAALFPLLASRAKIIDRMTPTAPHTLDGMAYMAYSQYTMGPGPYGGSAVSMDLKQDYDAIRWMQDNVQGTPVIVEAIWPQQYVWFSRFAIYTGLPDVQGWVWHEIQQRATLPDSIENARVNEIASFYSTTDLQSVEQFLQKYNVKYIIVGQVEKLWYPAEGLAKFTQQDGVMWKQVYHQADTTIYSVTGTGIPLDQVGR